MRHRTVRFTARKKCGVAVCPLRLSHGFFRSSAIPKPYDARLSPQLLRRRKSPQILRRNLRRKRTGPLRSPNAGPNTSRAHHGTGTDEGRRQRNNDRDTAVKRQGSGETAERRRNGGRTHRRKKRGPFDSGPLSRRCPAEGDRPHPRSRGAAGRQFTKVSPSLSASMRIGFSRFTSPARIRFERSLTMYRWIVRFTGRAP